MAGRRTKIVFRAYIDGIKGFGKSGKVGPDLGVARVTFEALSPGVQLLDTKLFPPVHGWQQSTAIDPTGTYVVWGDVPLDRHYYNFIAVAYLNAAFVPEDVLFRAVIDFTLARDNGSCDNQVELPMQVGGCVRVCVCARKLGASEGGQIEKSAYV